MSSGLNSQFGFSAAEAAYGTTTTVTKFLRHNKAEFTRVANRIQGAGIQSGVFAPVASHYIEATAAGTGTVELDVQHKGFGLLLMHLMGSGASAQQGGGAAYLQTHTLADPVGKSLTMQVGRPLRGGTVVPQTASGCKIVSADFSCNVGEILTMSMEIDAKSVENTTALAAASYSAVASPVTFHSGLMALKMGTYSSESAVSGVRGVSVKIGRPMDTEDYTTAGNTAGVGYKTEPVINDYADISGSVTADWLAKATFEDLANSNAGTSLVWEFVGTTAIATTYYPTFRIVLPGVYFESGSQSVDGVNELTNDWPFVYKYNGTNLPRIEYMTTDTTIV
jgi:hypothetical protein